MNRHRCECGRPSVCVPRTRKKSSRKTRAGTPTAVKDHTLCSRCWERFSDSLRAKR